ncbi:hypothetical protein GYMLUDRAFT_122920, partial [Collybiopsis luxurians FD-317 M1]
KSPYHNLATLRGARDAITSIAFSAYGKHLAAAGPGGVNVWNLESLQKIPFTLKQGERELDKAAFATAVWLHFAHLSRHVLLLGTADGHLQLWDYIEERLVSLQSNSQFLRPHYVLSVDVFPRHVPLGGHAKIVVSFADHFIWMGTLKGDGELKAKFSVTLEEGFMPKTVCFEPSNGNIIVFSMKGGNVTLVDSQTGNTVWRKTDAPDYMGSVSLDGPCTKFIASTPQGFEVYDLQKMTPLKRPKQQPVLLSIPKQACFDEENTKIIGGTDRRCAEVIDIKSGKVEHKLVYHQGGLVQSIAICPTSERLLVAIAGANGNQPSDVILWSKNR